MGSIPDGVNGIFHWINSSSHTKALGSTQPPAEMGIMNISWMEKVTGAQGWQPYNLHVILEPSGPVKGL
jgi:hypothetical protein